MSRLRAVGLSLCLLVSAWLWSPSVAAKSEGVRALVLFGAGFDGDKFATAGEAIQIYLRDFDATARPLRRDIQRELAEIRRAHSADLVVFLNVAPGGIDLDIDIFDLRRADNSAARTSEKLPSKVDDAGRYLALLVRGEIAAAASNLPTATPQAPPSELRKPVEQKAQTNQKAERAPVEPERFLIMANVAGLTALDAILELDVGAVSGYGWQSHFVGGVLEVGRISSRSTPLGVYENQTARLGVDVRPGRLSDGAAWSIFWGGQAGATWVKSSLAVNGAGNARHLANTFAPFFRASLWNQHRLSPRFSLSWEAGVEILPVAGKVMVARETALDTGHLRLRLALGGVMNL
ncbi:MAG: hypothetical protein SFV15_14270 [Polyangiaceae bacterium]|nr:hypothetical protein [Polyangiaceae bacterium]